MSQKQEQLFKVMEELAQSMVIMLHEDMRQEYLDKINNTRKLFSAECCRRHTGAEAGECMERFVNVMSHATEDKDFVDYIVHRTHRTLNQSFIGLMLKVIAEEATLAQSGRFDGRNEAAVKCCKSMMDRMSGTEMYMPFI